jgi:endonuclease/exonuclease/phosphatase family metal-dependent hydrolase
MWLFGLVMLIWFSLRWWPGDRLKPVRILNYFMPWLLMGLIPALLVAGLTKRKQLTFMLTIPTVGIGLVLIPQFLPGANAVAASQSLKIMSYNVLYVNDDLVGIANVIRLEQPDIVLLQEVILPMAPELRDKLVNLYADQPAYFAYEPTMAQAIISRYPIENVGVTGHGRAQKVKINTPAGPINVWNIHATLAVEQSSWYRQRDEMTMLADEIANMDEPLIVGGDFNTTPQSDNYQLIAQHLHNAHQQAGWGLGFTFPAQGFSMRNRTIDLQWKILETGPVRKTLKLAGIPREPFLRDYKYIPVSSGPVVRIDHIFYNDHFSAYKTHALSNAGGSDHLPIVTELLRTDGR